jgi:outer membrane protein assembly factor BamD (BamD/ComL family)
LPNWPRSAKRVDRDAVRSATALRTDGCWEAVRIMVGMAVMRLIKWRFSSIAALTLLGGLLVASSSAALADRRVALIVGNSSYQNVSRLPNPAKDADAIAEMFKKAGYEVSLLKDVGNLELKRSIRRFEDSASDADTAVVFYAGHGIEIGGTNYLIPVDAKLASDRDAQDEAIDLNRIVDAVSGAKGLRLIILDACRDNPFLIKMKRRQAQRQISSGLSPPATNVSSEILIAYAAARGETAADGDNNHSPFTTAILHHLPEPGVDIRLAFGKVRDEVREITDNRQEPYLYGSLGGTTLPLVPLREKPAQVVDDKVRDDYAAYIGAKTLADKYGSKKPLNDFLERYPTGIWSEYARYELSQLERQERLAAIPQREPPTLQPSPDNLAWDDVRDSTDPDTLRRFIQRFRDSPRMLEAQRRLDILLRNQREREDQARREKAEAELAKAWEAVQGTDDQAKLRDFLRRYPTTQYTDAAKQRLEAVIRTAQEREEAARVAAAEERRLKAEAEVKRAFDAVAAASDQSVVRDFIRRYPDSPYVAQAKSHLDTLIAAEQERKEQERLAAAEARRQKMEADAAAAWNSVKNSASPTDLQNFIKRFPESTLALKDATERLGAIDREAKERVAKAQAEAATARAAWDRIKDTNDTAVVQDFIKQYPNTPTALNDAKQYLDVLDRRNKEREAKARMEAEAAQAWNRIQNSPDQAEVRSFMKRYPDASVTLTHAAPRLAALEHEAAEHAEKARAEAAAARAAWDLVKGTNDPAELRDYINKYPDSPFSTRDAKARIDLLERQAKDREAKEKADAAAREAKEKAEAALRAAKEKAEAEMREAWDATRDSRDPSEFRAFIKRYPSSPFVTDARQSIAALEPKPEVTAKPEAEPDVSTRPIYRQRPDIGVRTAPPAPVQPRPAPPPPKVVERHHENAVEPPHRQAPPVHVERPAPQRVERASRPAPRNEARGGGLGAAGGSSGGGGFLSLGR